MTVVTKLERLRGIALDTRRGPRIRCMTRLRFGRLSLLVAGSLLAVAGCSSSTPAASTSPPAAPSSTSLSTPPFTSPSANEAVVVVSGFAAQSPFTTPTEACTSGLAAGLSDTGLREALLAAGYNVYTSPAQVGTGQITRFDGQGPFSDCPTPLPEDLTVNALEPIDASGKRLSAFINYLNSEYGVDTVDIVAHSMGGLFSRSAIKAIKDGGSPVTVRSFVTIGTPWEGSFSNDMATGAIPKNDCAGQESCTYVLEQVEKARASGQVGSAAQLTSAFLNGTDGKPGWNDAQGDALAGIPVTLFAGDRLTVANGNPLVWPNDGLVAQHSALATNVSDTVLPHRACVIRPDVHSAFFTTSLKLPQDRALTYDPVVMHGVIDALNNASTADSTLNRAGCP